VTDLVPNPEYWPRDVLVATVTRVQEYAAKLRASKGWPDGIIERGFGEELQKVLEAR